MSVVYVLLTGAVVLKGIMYIKLSGSMITCCCCCWLCVVSVGTNTDASAGSVFWVLKLPNVGGTNVEVCCCCCDVFVELNDFVSIRWVFWAMNLSYDVGMNDDGGCGCWGVYVVELGELQRLLVVALNCKKLLVLLNDKINYTWKVEWVRLF